MQEITIDLLRHGDVAAGKKLLGKTNEALSTLGWQQVRSVIDNKEVSWNKIISSPLQRCSAFAQEVADRFSLPLSIDARFEEMNFGQWDGQLFSDLYDGEDLQQLLQFMQEPSTTSPPEGETYIEFELRVINAWQELLIALHKQQIQHCLLVTHGGVIRTILSHVLGFSSNNIFRIEVPYACMTRIKQYENYSPRLIFHGGQL